MNTPRSNRLWPCLGVVCLFAQIESSKASCLIDTGCRNVVDPAGIEPASERLKVNTGRFLGHLSPTAYHGQLTTASPVETGAGPEKITRLELFAAHTSDRPIGRQSMSACDTPHWLDLPALEFYSAHRHAILGDLFCACFSTGGHQPLACATYWRVWGTPSYAMIRHPAFAR